MASPGGKAACLLAGSNGGRRVLRCGRVHRLEGGDEDALDGKWKSIVDRALAYLVHHFGPAQPLPESNALLPARPRFLAWIFGRSLNEVLAEWSLSKRVLQSMLDDQLPEVVVTFGVNGLAKLRASDGHPILWISIAPQTKFDPDDLAHFLAEGCPVHSTQLDWSRLGR